MPDEGRVATFQYDPEFVTSDIQVAPLMIPLRLDPYSFPSLSEETSGGCQGCLLTASPTASVTQ